MMKQDNGISAEDIAIIGAALIVLGDLFSLISLLMEKQEKKDKDEKCDDKKKEKK